MCSASSYDNQIYPVVVLVVVVEVIVVVVIVNIVVVMLVVELVNVILFICFFPDSVVKGTMLFSKKLLYSSFFPSFYFFSSFCFDCFLIQYNDSTYNSWEHNVELFCNEVVFFDDLATSFC